MSKYKFGEQLELFVKHKSKLDEVDIYPAHITSPMDPTFDPFDHLDKVPDIKCENDSKINSEKPNLPCEGLSTPSQ